MELNTLWFCLIAVLWTGYLVLEGFDFGVGMWLSVLGKTPAERRAVLRTIGPVWDGNEVWLLTAGGATFAAFPEWYATLFSGFYLPLFLILVALIVRGVGLEFRSKLDSPTWQRRWEQAIQVGSWIPALLWGVAFANIVRGVPLDAKHQFTGTFLGLLSPFALLGGLATTLLFLSHGAVFIALKTQGELRARALGWARRMALPTLAVSGAFGLWTQVSYSVAWTWPVLGFVALALGAAALSVWKEREGWSFTFSCLAIAGVVVLLFGSLFPDVMPALEPAHSLTVQNASSTPYTLRIMTYVAVALVPFVLAYQGWTYWVFRQRVTVDELNPALGEG
ncbi:cytochrome d ubiquinol oxidase subunit II [Corallococcus coralloides]|uniref:cytochrome d ubiquinol oxidase subunit II n=1 Tax=Corallococcus coralloides TaxID=184914 RepID=UPI00384D02AB